MNYVIMYQSASLVVVQVELPVEVGTGNVDEILRFLVSVRDLFTAPSPDELLVRRRVQLFVDFAEAGENAPAGAGRNYGVHGARGGDGSEVGRLACAWIYNIQ